MSEVQDAVAVVEMLGRFFVVGVKASLWVGKMGIEFAAAVSAYSATHKLEKGEMKYTKFLKKYGQDNAFLRFPEELSEEALREIGDRMEQMGIVYAWAPVFNAYDKRPIMAVRPQDVRKVTLILEDYKPKVEAPGSYLDSQDPETIKQAADAVLQNGDYEQVRAALDPLMGTLSDQLNHYTEREYAHGEEWITFDLNHPENYITVTAVLDVDEKGETYTKSTYRVFRNNQFVRQTDDARDGNKWKWGKVKAGMLMDLGIHAEYDQLVTIKTDAREVLKHYQKCFSEGKTQQKPDEKASETLEEGIKDMAGQEETETILIDADCINYGTDDALMGVVEIDDETRLKVPIRQMGVFADENGKLAVTLSGKNLTCDRDGRETGSMSLKEVKDRIGRAELKRKRSMKAPDLGSIPHEKERKMQ